MAHNVSYTEKELATAINDLLDLLSETERDTMFEKHHCCE